MQGRSGRAGAASLAAVMSLAVVGSGAVSTADAAVPTGFHVLAVVAGHGPAATLALDPGRQRLFVTEGSRRRLDVVDTRTDRSIGQVPLRGVPVGVAVDVRTHRVYLALRDGRVEVLAGARYRTVALIRVGRSTTAIAVDPAGHRAYVTASATSPTAAGHGVLAVVNTRRERLVREVTVGAAPDAVALDPGVHLAYVLDRGSNTLAVVDTTHAVVTSTLATGSGPAGIAVDTVDHDAWVTSRTTGTVEIVSGADPGAIMVFRLGGTPAGLAVDNVHQLAFIANRDGQLQIVGSGATPVTRTVKLPTAPQSVAVDPAGRRVYVSNGATGAVTVIRVRY
jgi:YVTN family beta-propeller protein